MSGKAKAILLGTLAGLVLLPALVQTSATRVVYLKATFNDSLGYIISDGKGPYQNASNVTVEFSELGELQFIIGERAGRRINFIFNLGNRFANGPCATCVGETWPDTSCTDPTLTDEPVTYVSFLTTISPYHKGPQLNFLGMSPGEIEPVRLAVYFETKARKYFRLRYYNQLDPEEYCGAGGPVMVQALDMNGDGTVDRWILSPVPNSNDKALFFRDYARKGNDWLQCSYGYFAMPFELALDRK